MSKSIKEIYEEKLAEMTAKTEKSEVVQELQIKSMSNDILDGIRNKVMTIIGKDKCWIEFSFRLGKLLGLLRQIANSYKDYATIEKEIGITIDDINAYKKYFGSLPYANKNGELVEGVMPSDIVKLQEYLVYIASKLGIFVDDEDIKDITIAKFEYIHAQALEYAKDTLAIEKHDNIVFDE